MKIHSGILIAFLKKAPNNYPAKISSKILIPLSIIYDSDVLFNCNFFVQLIVGFFFFFLNLSFLHDELTEYEAITVFT